MQECCTAKDGNEVGDGYETIQVKTTKAVCSNCEDYVAKNRAKAYAVVSCEGACLRGEISRRVADRLCHAIARGKTVRICQGSAVTKDGGQRDLLRQLPHVLILEGCAVQCASRLLQGFSTRAVPIVVFTDRLASFDQALFGSDELPSAEIDAIAQTVATAIHQRFLS